MLAGGVGGVVMGVTEVAAEKLRETMHEVVQTLITYESIMARMSGAVGGVEKAREVWEDLEKISDKSIFTEEQLAASFLHMKQIGLDPTMQSMKAYSNIAAAFGTQIGDLTGAVSMAAMGHYRSLRQFGIGAKEEGDKLKLTFRGQTTEIEKTSEAVSSYFVKLGETTFAGAAEAQLNTMGGAIKT